MRAYTVKDIKEFFNTRKSRLIGFNYPKWEGEVFDGLHGPEYFLMTDKMLEEETLFDLKFPNNEKFVCICIDDFDFVTRDSDPEEEGYPYLLDNFSKQWQEFLAERHPEYSKKLKAYGEKKLQACKNKYSNKKKDFLRELEYDFKKEAKPYLDMIDIASRMLDADDKELN